MQLSETVKLYPNKHQAELIKDTLNTYISTVNGLVSVAASGTSIKNYTTKHLAVNLPSALANQCIRDAKSILNKYYKNCHKTVLRNRRLAYSGSYIRSMAPKMPVLKKPCCYVNNQNYKIKDNLIEFPVMIKGKSKRLSVKVRLTDRQKEILSSSKLGTMRIVVKNNTLVVQVVYEACESLCKNNNTVMGLDLGIKCPVVSYISDGNIKFYGNGRKNKYMRRHYNYLRKKLQQSKNIKAVKRLSDKEQRIMKDIDHKISSSVIKTAVKHNVSVIKMERLTNIRSTTRKSRKNNHSIHTWSFYRLMNFIEYKAKLAGIKVMYVNPSYTSQKCPVCGMFNHATDRHYVCECGVHMHRDIVGAINICNSTEICGNSISA